MLPKTMIIRPYQKGEEEAIWEVYFRATHETVGRDYHSDLLHRWAPKDKDMDEWGKRLTEKKPLVAIIEGKITGMAELEESGFINFFYVHPEYQSRGIGSALLMRIEAEASKLGLSKIFADVSITAKSFFESRGFSVAEARSNVILGHPAPNFSVFKRIERSSSSQAS